MSHFLIYCLFHLFLFRNVKFVESSVLLQSTGFIRSWLSLIIMHVALNYWKFHNTFFTNDLFQVNRLPLVGLPLMHDPASSLWCAAMDLTHPFCSMRRPNLSHHIGSALRPIPFPHLFVLLLIMQTVHFAQLNSEF